jgi:hypothetical protein
VVHEHFKCKKNKITHIKPHHNTETIQEEEQVLTNTVHPKQSKTSLQQQIIDLVNSFEAAKIDPEKLRELQKELQKNIFIEVNSPGSESSDDRATTSSIEHTPGEDRLAERPATPHPRKKVKEHWDEELDKENRYPKERTLTPAELAIHTPPASPKLVRQNATLREKTLSPIERQERKRKYKKDTFVNNRQGQTIYNLTEQDN